MSGSRSEEWVEKAEEDYRAAVALDESDVPAVVCFLSQQCIEKYLKAALVALGKEPPRTHDLIHMQERVAKLDPRFSTFAEPLQVLMPYSVLVRYPGGKVTSADARAARETMRSLRDRIRELLGLERET